MLIGLFLIFCGIIGISPIIIKNRPDSEEYFQKISPYYGIIGVILFVIGAINLVITVLALIGSVVFDIAFFRQVLLPLFLIAIELGLGFVLGFGLIKKYVLDKIESGTEKGNELYYKLLSYQIPLGATAIIAGVLRVIF